MSVEVSVTPQAKPAIDPCDELERASLLESRKFYVEQDARASDSFDNAMLTLCAGALALSVTLKGANARMALNLAQGSFAIALVAEAVALRVGRLVSLKRVIDDHDARLQEQIPPLSRERRKDVTYHLKNLVLYAFVFGVWSMVFFASSQTTGE